MILRRKLNQLWFLGTGIALTGIIQPNSYTIAWGYIDKWSPDWIPSPIPPSPTGPFQRRVRGGNTIAELRMAVQQLDYHDQQLETKLEELRAIIEALNMREFAIEAQGEANRLQIVANTAAIEDLQEPE